MTTPVFLITDASKTYKRFWDLKGQGIVLDNLNPGPIKLSLCSLNPNASLKDYFMDTTRSCGLVSYSVDYVGVNELEFNWNFVESSGSGSGSLLVPSIPPFFTEYKPTQVIEYYQDSLSIYCTFLENGIEQKSNKIRFLLTLKVKHIREQQDTNSRTLVTIDLNGGGYTDLGYKGWKKIYNISGG